MNSQKSSGAEGIKSILCKFDMEQSALTNSRKGLTLRFLYFVVVKYLLLSKEGISTFIEIFMLVHVVLFNHKPLCFNTRQFSLLVLLQSFSMHNSINIYLSYKQISPFPMLTQNIW